MGVATFAIGLLPTYAAIGVAAPRLLLLAAVQSDAAFESWGWRIPFLPSAVLVGVDLWVRLSIEESPVFAAMGMRMAENISYYLVTIISISFLALYAGTADDKPLILKALLIGSVVHFMTIPLVGALSDRVGRRPLYLAGASASRCGRGSSST